MFNRNRTSGPNIESVVYSRFMCYKFHIQSIRILKRKNPFVVKSAVRSPKIYFSIF